ncbi:PspC domain-containing protein [Mucilaginibacter lacusdianchii]|uniref:PspC domain-containing protein n=1 Tax=Mucilaginibacter lacusdianchii TaxID=2684211 RepID=UPI00131B0278|nr:PspC domain-containing protein [Mucilaginibacter sp. JXJ CY 39]
MNKKLYRDEQHKTIGGVCAGLADYFGTEVSVMRLIFVLALIFKGGGLLIYIVLWIVLPRKEFVSTTPGVDYMVQPPNQFEQSYINKPRRASNAGLIGGLILLLLGSFLLLDEFEVIPDINFGHLWPIIPMVVGGVFIITSRKEKNTNTNAPIE